MNEYNLNNELIKYGLGCEPTKVQKFQDGDECKFQFIIYHSLDFYADDDGDSSDEFTLDTRYLITLNCRENKIVSHSIKQCTDGYICNIEDDTISYNIDIDDTSTHSDIWSDLGLNFCDLKYLYEKAESNVQEFFLTMQDHILI